MKHAVACKDLTSHPDATTNSLWALSNHFLLWALVSYSKKGRRGDKATTQQRSQLFLKLKHETLQLVFTFIHLFTYSTHLWQVCSVSDAVLGAESTAVSQVDTVPALMEF